MEDTIKKLYEIISDYAEKNNLDIETSMDVVINLLRESQNSVLSEEHTTIPVNLFYTGVGSRDISDEEYDLMEAIAKYLASLGYKLRSGKAPGSDSAFESGVTEFGDITLKEIYVPWKGFKGNEFEGENIPLDPPSSVNYGISWQLVKEIHPAAERLKQAPAKLHQRNCHQVLGRDLENPKPSKFLLACADVDRNGEIKGGTRTAWKLAEKFGVPCFNIRGKTKQEIFAFLKTVM